MNNKISLIDRILKEKLDPTAKEPVCKAVCLHTPVCRAVCLQCSVTNCTDNPPPPDPTCRQ